MTHHLAYCSANSDVAEALIGHLSRKDLLFNRITPDPSAQTFGQFAENLMYQSDPVVLLLTDNLLKDEGCMAGLYPAIQSLLAREQLLVITAAGKDEAGSHVPTEYDRVVHVMKYMNFWQGKYLNLVETMRQTDSESERQAMYKQMEAASAIPGQIGDLLTLLMNAGNQTLDWDALTANRFEPYFQYFGLYELFAEPPVYPASEPATTDEPEILPQADKPVPPVVFHQPIAPVRLPEDDALLPFEEEELDAGNVPEPAPAEPEDKPFFVESSPAAPLADLQEERDALLEAVHEGLAHHTDEVALALCQDAVERFPEDQAFRLALLKAYLKQGDFGNANMQLTILRDIGLPERDAFDLTGDIREAQGNLDEALYCWIHAAQLAPDRSDPIQQKIDRLQEWKRSIPAGTAEAVAPEVSEPAEAAEVHVPEPAEPDSTEANMSVSVDAPRQPDPEPITQQERSPEKGAHTRLTVFITGATSGIGRATAEQFAAYGHRIILVGRRLDRLEQMQESLQASAPAGEVWILQLDVRDREAVAGAVQSLPVSWQDIDVLINNAGLAKGLDPIHEGSLDHWDTMIDTNIKGLLYVTRAIAPGMVSRKKGHIVNIGSSAGKEVYPKGNVYCATKFAVDALSRGMRLDLHEHNIRVSQVSPGHVEDTEFAFNRFDGDTERARIYEDFQPLKAVDVANAIYFMVTQPERVNIQDMWMYSSQQAASTIINRSGR
jgi:NADP-dependent 3-hydroxy acid dehydrogenase YdfG